MNISLTPELERQVEERLKSGLYTSASELVREALRLFFQYDAARSHQIGLLDQRIREGLAQLDRGEGIPGPAARRRSHARLAARLSGRDTTRGEAAE
jgi:antitoxin ParD1/3/4